MQFDFDCNFTLRDMEVWGTFSIHRLEALIAFCSIALHFQLVANALAESQARVSASKAPSPQKQETEVKCRGEALGKCNNPQMKAKEASINHDTGEIHIN